MDRAGVEQVVKSVITQYGLPLTLVNLSLQGEIWTLDLREDRVTPLRLTLHDGSGQLMRRAFLRALDLDD
jgi:hypothetical protein